MKDIKFISDILKYTSALHGIMPNGFIVMTILIAFGNEKVKKI